MTVAKLSVSLEASVARMVRSAASEAGVSVSTWLSEAARAKGRQRALREALEDHLRAHGSLDADETSALVGAARARSVVTRGRRRRR
ncbi:MAG TPA: hypothetical protein VHE35_21360 [Kofleriaceae bacterium]|nr:hypothetical protein [Kofleriaceae bacterium]